MAVAIVVVVGLTAEILATQAVRGAVNTYFELIGAANRRDLAEASRLCSDRYRAGHTLQLNAEGGIKGLPRTIHMNYQAWREGKDVLICPTKQRGPVYRFVKQGEDWKFDGLAGLLRDGRVEPPVEEE